MVVGRYDLSRIYLDEVYLVTALVPIDDVHGSDGLSLGMLGVGDSITDHVLKDGGVVAERCGVAGRRGELSRWQFGA